MAARNSIATLCCVLALGLTACAGDTSAVALPQTDSPNAHANDRLAAKKGYSTDKPLLFVADSSKNRVYIFPHTGLQLVGSIGVDQPHGVAVSSAGTVYVASYSHNEIETFAIGSSTLRGKISFTKPDTLFVDPKNDLYVSSAETGTVAEYAYDASKHAVGTTPLLTIADKDIPVADSWKPSGLAMDIDGNLFIADDGTASPCGCLWELESGRKPGNIHPVFVANSQSILDRGQSLSVVAVTGRIVAKRLYDTFFIGLLASNGVGSPISVFLPTQSAPQYQLQGPYAATYMTVAANGDMYVSDGAGSNAVYGYHPNASVPFEVLTNYYPPANDYFSTTDGVATWK